MDLTKEAIEKIEDMTTQPEAIILNDRLYTTKTVYEVTEPTVKGPILIHTLRGIVDYISTNIDGLTDNKIALHIISPTEVKVISSISSDWRKREFYIEANFKNSGHPFGREMEKEQFIVSLLANFEKTKERDELLSCIASIKKSSGEITEDDGISQSVTVNAGVTLVSEKTIENPIKLAPIRTFTEVDGQPKGDYVFRMAEGRNGINLVLHDSNGDDWEVKAIEKIRDFFQEEIVKKLKKDIAILG